MPRGLAAHDDPNTANASPLRVPWLQVALWFLASRLWQMSIGVLALVNRDGLQALSPDRLTGLFCRWDCGWYLGIVEQGYGLEATDQPGATNWSFYPLYPLLIRGVAVLTGVSPVLSGALVSNACFLVALGLIYRYVRVLGGDHAVARNATLLVAFLPQGVVFSAVYTESLFLLLAVSGMLALREQRYLLSSPLLAALSAVRSNGVFVIVFAVALLWDRHGFRQLVQPWRAPLRYLPILAAPLGAFAFWSYAYVQTGDAFAMATSVRHGWGWSWESPVGNLLMHLRAGGLEARVWTVGSLCVFASALTLWQKRFWPELVFCLAVFLLIWGGSIPNSLWRYSMVLFPAWVGLAFAMQRWRWLSWVVVPVFLSAGVFLGWAWATGQLVSI